MPPPKKRFKLKFPISLFTHGKKLLDILIRNLNPYQYTTYQTHSPTLAKDRKNVTRVLSSFRASIHSVIGT